MNSNPDEILLTEQPPKILWTCIARHDTVLAEAALDYSDDVFQTATELLAKKPTPGFEYHTQNRWSRRKKQQQQQQQQRGSNNKQASRPALLKGIKFHVYEAMIDEDGDDSDKMNTNWETASTTDNNHNKSNLRIWVYAAVYDPSTSVSKHDVQSFLEKMVTLSENMRDQWIHTESLGLQGTFAPILKQRMQEVTYYGKMALLEQQVQACHDTMRDNIEVILANQERLDDLDREATHLQEMASVFKRNSRKLRRAQMMKNAKHGLILGTVVTAATAAVVIPPLVAIL